MTTFYVVADRYGRKISDYYRTVEDATRAKGDATDYVVAVDNGSIRPLTSYEDANPARREGL